ncbi:VOC family protein [Bacillus sp. CECT 9360]|uniref:VOC family protein n=1 Tax=Bacillus sp. CECT 9360 TaxID=2845821 RepID=UPI001E462AE4|nr:VOC family protein [Bacillus sp. CECT 9360]CAH0344096.1 Catechol-2,3-dioxygenase [Bacillus sp. CECT 9360]
MKFHQKPITYVGSVHLIVQDLKRSLSFYQETIGMKVLQQSGGKAVLTTDGQTPLLTIEQPENVAAKERNRTGLYHFAILVPERSDLAKVLLHLLQTGYPPQGASDHLVSEAIYLADPDGHGIEIYMDRPSESWTWEDKEIVMTTEALDGEGLLAEAKGESWTGLPSGTVMGHIHLQVSDLDKAEKFYCEGLGFDLVNSKYGQSARFVSSGGYHHHIGLNTWHSTGAPAPTQNTVGLKLYTLVLPTEEARQNAVQQLQQMGEWVTQENGTALTKDPSGNHIQLLVYGDK